MQLELVSILYIYTVYGYIRMICLSKIDMINLIYSTFLHFSLNSAKGFPFLKANRLSGCLTTRKCQNCQAPQGWSGICCIQCELADLGCISGLVESLVLSTVI